MLLPEKPNAVENLPSAGSGSLETLAQLGVFELEALDALGSQLGSAGCSVDRLHSCLGMESAPPKTAQLLAKVSNQALQLFKRLCVRTIAVGFQVCSLVR
jgi:hypothetical protein